MQSRVWSRPRVAVPGLSRLWFRVEVIDFVVVTAFLGGAVHFVLDEHRMPVVLVLLASMWGALVVVLIGTALRSYRPRLTLSALDEVPGLTAMVWLAAPFVVPPFLRAGTPVAGWLLLGCVAVVVLFLVRVVMYAVLRRRRRRGAAHRSRTMVLGGGAVAHTLVRSARDHLEAGLEPVLVMDDDADAWVGAGVVVVPRGDRLAELIVAHRIRTVVVAFSLYGDASLVEPLRACDHLRCEIFVVPRLFEFVHQDRDMDRLHGTPLVWVRRLALRTAPWVVKNVVSATVAAFALLLLSPLLGAVAAVIKSREPHAPVIFRQERIGQHGLPFTMYKFRSMRVVPDGVSDHDWAPDHTRRVDRVGAFLRKYSIDELPQLWNVLRGDMSLVGPRPERPFFVQQFGERIPGYHARHRVLVGLTGWAAINGLRGDTSIEDRALFDNYYIENWSLWLDLKIVLATVRVVVFGHGR